MQKLVEKSVLWLLLVSHLGCREQAIEPDLSRLGLDYFPLETGMYWEYEVNLTTYNLLDSVSTDFFLREIVTDSFTNLSGGVSYKLERFVRENQQQEWLRDSVWVARLNAYQAIRVENNIPFVKLSFPLEEGKSWNGNALNNREVENYQATNFNGSLLVNDSLYQNTVLVVQREVLDTIVFQDVRKEYFAKNVGLIKKEFIQLNYCSSPECFGKRQIDSGRKLFMELMENGKE